MTSELEEVARERGAPGVGVKRFLAAPCAAIKSEGALQGGDVAFDAGAEVSKAAIGDSVSRHFGNLETEVLAEDDVADAERTNVGEISSGSKATIEHDIMGCSPHDLHGSFDGGHGEGRIARIASQRLQVENEAGRAGGKADLVTVEDLTAIFDDHVGVWLEDRNNFLLRWNLFLLHDATHRLIDDALRERTKVPQFAVQLLSCRLGVSSERCDDLPRALERARGQLQKLPVLGNPKTVGPRAEDFEHPSPDTPKVIDEPGRDPATRTLHQPHEHANTIAQQRRVGRMMDVGVDDRAVDANLLAALDFPIDGLANDHPVDHLDRRSLDALDVRLQRRALRRPLTQSEATEASIRQRVVEMERQLLVAEAAELFDD